MARDDDYSTLAATMPRAQFVERHPYPFLFGTLSLRKPYQPGRTMMMNPLDTRHGLLKSAGVGPVQSVELLLMPIRKIQDNFPSMITLGRTANNDVIIADVQVSKFHAFFRLGPDGVRYELADAGSRNGTTVRGRKLEPRGPAQLLAFGDLLGFGKLEFSFLDSGTCWDRLQKTG